MNTKLNIPKGIYRINLVVLLMALVTLACTIELGQIEKTTSLEESILLDPTFVCQYEIALMVEDSESKSLISETYPASRQKIHEDLFQGCLCGKMNLLGDYERQDVLDLTAAIERSSLTVNDSDDVALIHANANSSIIGITKVIDWPDSDSALVGGPYTLCWQWHNFTVGEYNAEISFRRTSGFQSKYEWSFEIVSSP